MIMSFETTALPLEKFQRDGNTLTAELSDFGKFADQIGGQCGLTYIHRLYDDACDAGIGIRSHHTGRIVRFYWNEAEGKDNDYSLGYCCWKFTVCPEDARHSHIQHVTIIND